MAEDDAASPTRPELEPRAQRYEAAFLAAGADGLDMRGLRAVDGSHNVSAADRRAAIEELRAAEFRRYGAKSQTITLEARSCGPGCRARGTCW